MNNLFTVLKATFINDWGLNGFSKTVTSTKEKKKILTQMLVMGIGVIAIAYSVTMYALLMADALEQVGFLELILVMGIAASILLTFFTSVYKAQGTLFTARDYDMLLALPIKPSVILTSKLINLLLFNWLFTAFAVLPPAIIYYMRTDNVSWLYFIMVIISIIFIPLISVIVASLIAVIISYFASKFKYKNLTVIIGTMLLMVIIFVGSFQMNKIIEYVFSNASSIMDGLGKIYPPMVYLINALVNIDFLEFGKFILVSIIPFILFVMIFSKVFNKINSRLGETYKKANYKMTSLKTNSAIRALTNKEIKRYFSTPIYVMNTSVGMLMVVVAAVATLFVDGQTLAMFMEMPYSAEIFPLMILGLCIFGIGMGSTTNSSISLEGKNLWIIKALPIREKDIFLGKILLSLMITLPLNILCNFIFFIGLKFSVTHLIWNLVITILYCLFAAIIGLVINLYFPKMEWSTATAVVKQSASVMITMLITFASIGLPVAAFILLKLTNITIFLSVILVILIMLLIVAWIVLNKEGVKKFREL